MAISTGRATKGGTNGLGTVFRISPGGSETSLYYFGSQPNDGSNPLYGLVQASDGNLYGTTVYGGLGKGTIFELTVAFAYRPIKSPKFSCRARTSSWPSFPRPATRINCSPPPIWCPPFGSDVTGSRGDKQRRRVDKHDQFWRGRWPAEILSLFDQPVGIKKFPPSSPRP